MPLLKTVKINHKSAYALWEVTETYDQLVELVGKDKYIQLPDDDVTNETKRIEWVAGRLTLAKLLESCGMPYMGIYKDSYGKPHLNEYKAQISLSHSHPFVAAIINTEEPVGIDVEQPKEKLLRISQKFLSKEEQKVCLGSVELMCMHWCAKEALYKLYGKKELIFKENLVIKPSERQNELIGKILVNNDESEYEMRVERVSDSFLVYTI